MTSPSPAELRDRTRRRDAQSVSSHQVHLTNPQEFGEELVADYNLGVIADNILRIAITDLPAHLNDIVDSPAPGGDRMGIPFLRKFVEASYIARRQLTKLSVYCGVVIDESSSLSPTAPIRAKGATLTLATLAKIAEATYRVQALAAKCPDLDVRGGGVYVSTGDWTADPKLSIATPPEPRCAVCDVPIHLASGHWRDATGRFDVMRSGAGRHGITTVLDHEHTPEVAS